MKKNSILLLCYLAMYAALYVVLKFVGNMIPFLQMPNGGSIELELIALFICAYHLGTWYGMACGLLSFLLTVLLGAKLYVVSLPQFLLDYILPLVVCGAAKGLFPSTKLNTHVYLLATMGLGLLCGYGFYVASGSIVWLGIVVAVVVIGFFHTFKPTAYFGILIAMVLKYFVQVLSGVYFWFDGSGGAAGSLPAWIFSLNYNAWYNLATLTVCLLAVPLLFERLKKAKIHFIQ